MAALPPVQPSSPIASVSSDGYEALTVTALSGAGATACYTAASNTATPAIRRVTKITKIVIANDTAGAINITVAYYRNATTTAYGWYPVTSLAARGQLVFTDPLMTMEPLDELRVTGNTGVNVFVSTREYQGNSKQ